MSILFIRVLFFFLFFFETEGQPSSLEIRVDEIMVLVPKLEPFFFLFIYLFIFI